MDTTLISCAIIRRGSEILLVRQRDKDAETRWGLPGGAGQSGELPLETLTREVREESGLKIVNPGPIAYVTGLRYPPTLAFVFDVRLWTGDLVPADPDDDILHAEFMPAEAAIELLELQPSHFVRSPLTPYLNGRAGTGSFWLYRRDDVGDALVTRLAEIG
jgi:8-oxo-dGTP diphosphatase